MAYTVVLLDGETGGFFVEENSVRLIPKISEDFRLHLTAVNALVKALEAGEKLDPARAELETLVVQAANLALRRLERSIGIEAAQPTAVATEQFAGPLGNAVAASEIEVITETAVAVIPDEGKPDAVEPDEITAESTEDTHEPVLVEATPDIPIEATVAEAAAIEIETEAASATPAEPEVETTPVAVVAMEPVMIEAVPNEAMAESEPVAIASMEAVAVEAAPQMVEPATANIEPVIPVEPEAESAPETAPETAIEAKIVEAPPAVPVEAEINQTAPTDIAEPIEAAPDADEPLVATAIPAAPLETEIAEPEIAKPVTNGASVAHAEETNEPEVQAQANEPEVQAQASEPEVQAEAIAPLTLPEASESPMVALEKKIEESTETNPQQLEPIPAQAATEASS
jgi:hypothetical protein